MRSGLKINDNRKWMNNLTRRDGDRVAACMPVQHRNLGTYGSEAFATMSISPDFLFLVEAGGIENPAEKEHGKKQ